MAIRGESSLDAILPRIGDDMALVVRLAHILLGFGAGSAARRLLGGEPLVGGDPWCAEAPRQVDAVRPGDLQQLREGSGQRRRGR